LKRTVVTSTFVFEGEGVVSEYVGGYEDRLRKRTTTPKADRVAPQEPSRFAAAKSPSHASGKLSYRERREFEELPARIEALEAEQRTLNAMIADSGFYKQAAEAIAAALERLEGVGGELGRPYLRWGTAGCRPQRGETPPA